MVVEMPSVRAQPRGAYPEDLRRWEMQYSSDESLDSTRVPASNYEEIKKLIILAGIFFMIAILFFLMKFEVPVDAIFKWSPIVWLLGVLLCCLLMNFLCYCRRVYKKRRELNLRRQQELLLALNLAASFQCLPTSRQEFFRESRILLPLLRTGSGSSLPSYNQALSSSATVPSKPNFTRALLKRPPPTYEDALRMSESQTASPPYS